MKKFLFIALTVLVLAACSKEKRIYNNLYKKGGEWNVTSWKATKGALTYDFINNTNGYKSAVFNFNEDGSATMVTVDKNSVTETTAFHYNNTANKLMITKIKGEVGNNASYRINWKKDKMTLIGVGLSQVDSETINVVKK